LGVDIYLYLFNPQPYEQLVLPAYERFRHHGDLSALVSLLKDAIPKLESEGHGEFGHSKAGCEESIAILTGKKYYSSQAREPKEGDVTTDEDIRIFVDFSVAPDLVDIFCIPRNLGVNPKQNMSGPLVQYLYSQSSWMEDCFMSAEHVTGPKLEIQFGESSLFFTRAELESFDKELSRINRPTDEEVLNDGFDNLRTLVHKAATDPKLKLLYAYI